MISFVAAFAEEICSLDIQEAGGSAAAVTFSHRLNHLGNIPLSETAVPASRFQLECQPLFSVRGLLDAEWCLVSFVREGRTRYACDVLEMGRARLR